MCTPNDIMASGTTVLTRNAAGDWSYNQAASQTVTYGIAVSSMLLRRTGFFEDTQNQFGGAGIPASAQVQNYRPDVIGGMSAIQQLIPRTAFKIKGYKLLGYDVICQITTNNLTTFTTRVDLMTHVDNSANVVSAVLANAANGLVATQRANPYVTNVALAAGQQIYRSVVDTDVIIELAVVTPASSTFKLWSVDLICEFNYN